MNELEGYLEPAYQSKKVWPDRTMGSCTSFWGIDEEINDPDLFIVSLLKPEYEQLKSSVRNSFYNLFTHNKIKIVDLGNIKLGNSTADSNFALQFVLESIESLKKPIIILGARFSEFEDSILEGDNEVSFVSNNISKEKAGLSLKENLLVNIIGFQTYLTDPHCANEFSNNHGIHLRLGHIKESILHAEPVLRDSSVTSIEVNSIEQSIDFSPTHGSSNGISNHNICQLSYYSGRSNSKKILFIDYNALDTNDNRYIPDISGQIIWHYCLGINHTAYFDSSSKSLKSYHMTNIPDDMDIVFFHDESKGFWWCKINFDGQTEIVSTSETDYKKVLEGNLPISITRKFNSLR